MNLHSLNPQYFLERRYEKRIFGLIGSLFNGVLNYESQQNTNAANYRINERNINAAKEAATTAFNRQRQLIQEQNEYNSFSNQRKLMEEAGYNPNSLVGGAAGSAVSSGSTNAPQAEIPSPIPMQAAKFQFAQDFANIKSVLADAKLKEAQTEKTNSETVGQNIENDFNTIQTVLQSKWGDIEREYNLNELDSRRALNDAQRYVQNSVSSLNMDELYNMRPKEAAKVVADTLTSQSQSLLNQIQAAKTQEEKELLAKRYALDLRIAASTIALNYAQSYNLRTNADLWQPNKVLGSSTGLLYRNAMQVYDTNTYGKGLAKYNYMKVKTSYDTIFSQWVKTAASNLRAAGLRNDYINAMLDPSNPLSGVWHTLSNATDALPMSSGWLKPDPVMSLTPP